MSIFSKLFGSSQERRIKRFFTETQERVNREYEPLGKVALAIGRAASNNRDAVKNLLLASTEKERMHQEILVFFEFVYFYMHLAMRSAFVQLTEPQLKKLQGYIGPVMSAVAVDSYFAHWPNDLKEKMVSEFYDKLNSAELEYSECTKTASIGQARPTLAEKLQALFMKLGSNISMLSGHDEDDLAVILPVSDVALQEWKRMRLDDLIADVKSVG